MVQILKETVRTQITEAALARFASDGFLHTSMAAIASEAGVATGTLYKYFENKHALFGAIIDDGFVNEYRRLTRSRINSFVRPEDASSEVSGMSAEPGALLRFLTKHRLQVVILLSKAEGTPYGTFAKEYVEDMEAQALLQARQQFPWLVETATFLFMAHRIFENSVRDTVAILEHFREEETIAQALAVMSSCQVAALMALIDRTQPEEAR